MGGLVYWLLLDLLTGEYPLEGVSPDQVAASFIAISVFASGIWLGAQGKGWSQPTFIRNVTTYSLNARSLMIAIWVSFVFGMFYYAYASDFDLTVMVNGLLVGRFDAPWVATAMGDWSAFLIHTEYFGYILPCLTVLLAQKRGWIRPSVMLAILLTIIVIVFTSQSGSRRMVGVMLGAAFVCWTLLQPRLNSRTLIIVGIAVALLLGMLEFMLKYRDAGYGEWLEGETVHSQYGFLHVDDNFLRLAQITSVFPDLHPYVGLQPIYYTLVRPVPRVFWPGKPVDGGFDMAAFFGLKGVSLTLSIVGELYACYGLLAVFLGGLFFGRLGSLFNNIFSGQGSTGRAAVYGIGLLALFASLRSMSEMFVYFYILFGWMFIIKLLKLMSEGFHGAGKSTHKLIGHR